MLKSVLLLLLFGCLVVAQNATLKAFFDGYFSEQQMTAKKIYGAAILMVDAKQVLFQQGYGFQSKDEAKIVDTEKSIFALGTLSRMFAATAAFQQFEKNAIGLKRDQTINSAFEGFKNDARVPFETVLDQDAWGGAFPKHTLARQAIVNDLLAHTTGFDSTVYLSEYNTDQVKPLTQFVKEKMPLFVRQPKIVPADSHFGVTVLGLLLELSSKLEYDKLLSDAIFTPLNMKNSFAKYSNDLNSNANLVKPGIQAAKDTYTTVSQYGQNVALYPSAGAYSTASDIGKLLMSLLDKNSTLMKPESISDMFASNYVAHTGITGMASLWTRSQYNGINILSLSGGLAPFGGLVAVFPEQERAVVMLATGEFGDYLETALPRIAELVTPVDCSGANRKRDTTTGQCIESIELTDYRPLPESRTRFEFFAGCYNGVNYGHSNWLKMARTTVTKICIENFLDYLVAKVYPAEGEQVQLTLLETDYGAFRAARRVGSRAEFDAFLSDRWTFVAPDGNTNRNSTVKSGYLIRGANDAFEREGSFNYLYALIPLVAFFCLNIIYCLVCLLYVILEVIVEVKKPGGSSATKDRIGRLEAMLEPFNFEKEEEAVDESRWKDRNEDADFLVDSKGIQAKKSFYKKGGRTELTARARTCILIVEALGILTLAILSALNLLNFVGMFVNFRSMNTNRMFPQDSSLKGFMSIPIINAVVLAVSLFFCFLHLITRGKKCRVAGCILFSGYPLAILTNAAFIPFQVYFNWFGPWFY